MTINTNWFAIGFLVLLGLATTVNGDLPAFPVSTHAAYQTKAAISGNTVVWFDNRNGNWDIYGKDLLGGGEFPVTNDSADQWSQLTIDGDIVASEDQRHALTTIYAHNLTTQTETKASHGNRNVEFPDVSGDIIVWQDSRNGFPTANDDIYAFNVMSLTEFEVSTNLAHQAYPAIDGNIVVWWDHRNGTWDLYGADLSDGTEFFIHNPPGSNAGPLDIDGDIVVWHDTRNGVADSSIYGYNLSTDTEFEIATAAGEQEKPVISGNLVAWMDKRNGNWDIYGYDILTGEEIPVSTKPGAQESPAISGGIVVWEDWANAATGPDIYGAYIPEPATLSLLAVGACLPLLRRRR